jgi:hypothetical protein
MTTRRCETSEAETATLSGRNASGKCRLSEATNGVKELLHVPRCCTATGLLTCSAGSSTACACSLKHVVPLRTLVIQRAYSSTDVVPIHTCFTGSLRHEFPVRRRKPPAKARLPRGRATAHAPSSWCWPLNRQVDGTHSAEAGGQRVGAADFWAPTGVGRQRGPAPDTSCPVYTVYWNSVSIPRTLIMGGHPLVVEQSWKLVVVLCVN